MQREVAAGSTSGGRYPLASITIMRYRASGTYEVWCEGAERVRTAASQFCSASDDSATTDDPERQTTTPEE